MMRQSWSWVVVAVLAPAVVFAANGTAPAKVDWGQLPLVFEPNVGQTADVVRFVARTPGHQVFATEEGLVLKVMEREGPLVPEASTPGQRARFWVEKEQAGTDNAEARIKVAVVRLKLVRGAGKLRWQGEERQASYSNYFLGNDPQKWRPNVPHYARVLANNALPGVDWVLYGSGRQLQYDFVVAPGADPQGLQLEVEGAEEVKVDEEGNLRLLTAAGVLVQKAPLAYQEEAGGRVVRECRWQVRGRRVRLAVGTYDRSKPLVVDPVSLVYSTYLGGGSGDIAWALAVDGSGAAYVAGHTWSTDFPTQDPFQGSNAGFDDAFVAKLSPAGNSLVYSTYLGGGSQERARALAVDSTGAAYVAGETWSTDFPTQDPFQGSKAGGYDAFVAKLSPAGNSLAYSTYLGGGGSDYAWALAVDSSGAAYVAGYTDSTNFPTQNPYQGSNAGLLDAFVAKLSPAGNSLAYSTYLGGGDSDYATALAVDSSGAAYVAGWSASTDFPTQNPYQGSHAGGYDAFVAELSPAGNSLVYSTYLGGGDSDYATALAVDSSGAAYVAGDTWSTDFPTQNPFQGSNAGFNDAFVAKLSPAGDSLVYSTYLGGEDEDPTVALAMDSRGAAYVAGYTLSTDFPTQNPLQGSNAGGFGGFVAKLSPVGNSLIYSTYLGGGAGYWAEALAVDSSGAAYVAGYTLSANFPTQDPFQGSHAGGLDAFVAKLGPFDLSSTAVSCTPNPSAYGQAVTCTATVTGSSPTGTVDFSDGATALCSGVALSGGQASCVTSSLSVGSHTITAGYSGDANHAPSSGSTLQEVNPAPTTTVVSCTPNPSTYGQAVTCTATVTGSSPTGTVDFLDGAVVLCSGVALSGGQASCVTSSLSAGSHTITANYSGDGNNAPSSGSTVQQVNPAPSTTVVSCTPNPSTYGQLVTCTATVTGSSPTGTVDFLDGATALCSGVALSGGQASCLTSSLSADSHTITANYSGDGNNAPSSGSTVQEVNPAPTTTVVSSSPNPSTPPQVVTLTVTVTAQYGTVPTGTVTVVDTTTATTLCSSVPLNASGQASCTTTALTTPGHHSLQATYSGDANHSGSSGSGSHQVQQPEAIPTLSQWGLLALASVLTLAAMWSLRRRQLT